MPRTARLNVKGGIFHVVSRFTRDERWLQRKGARAAYLRLLAAATERTDAKILAYCLMSNHVHLVVQQGQDPLALLTKSVHTGFAVWAHASTKRTKAGGPIFAGRPREILVEAESYLLELVRYVHNNPVRAKLVARARESAWSSHRAYIGEIDTPPWLDTSIVLARFGRGARKAFAKFVDDGRDEPRRPELSGVDGAAEAAMVRRALGDGHRISDGVLGTEEFTERVRDARERVVAQLSQRVPDRATAGAERPDVRTVIDACFAAFGVDAIAVTKRPKARKSSMAKRLAIWTWVHEYQGSQIELARALSLSTSIVSQYFAQAVEFAGDFDEMGAAVVRSLKRKRERQTQDSTALPVRYHVDVDEI